MMKKIVNLFLRLPFVLLIIVLTGIISWETMNIVSKEKEIDELKTQKKYDTYGNGVDSFFAINNKLIEYLVEIVEIYKENGLDGVESYCEIRSNDYGYHFFDLILQDELIVYDSGTGERITCKSIDEANELVILRYRSSDTDVRIMDGIDLCKYTKYGWRDLEVTDYFDETMMAFLRRKAPQFYVRINPTKDAINYYYKDVDANFEKECSLLDEELDIYVFDARERIIYCAIAYTVLWIFEICRQINKVSKNDKPGRVEKFKTEIILILAYISVLVFRVAISNYNEEMNYVNGEELYILQLVTTSFIVASAAVLYSMINIIIKKICRRTLIKDSLIILGIKKITKVVQETYGIDKYGSGKDIKRLYLRKVCVDMIVTFIAIYAISSSIYYLGDDGVVRFGLILAIAYVLYIYHSIKEYKYLRLFNKVNRNIDCVYNGMYEAVERDDSEIMGKLCNLSTGFEKSVAKQIEAEKLQIELVTNVSHDLKTPLTSVISYVDLLSKEELPPVAADYVKILVDKSDRLRDIVSDVFDLAKATSGEEIELENIDGVILVNQVLSDMDDAIKESGREVKLKSEVENAPITANGQKLYRVFQNVIDNALKYSMPGTRIFVNTYLEGNDFVFTIKNVSEFEIDFTEEEILSRFVRGDKARHSEGNGLGLSIAKSFTEQCGGRFGVKLDDDMFKVIIRLK